MEASVTLDFANLITLMFDLSLFSEHNVICSTNGEINEKLNLT